MGHRMRAVWCWTAGLAASLAAGAAAWAQGSDPGVELVLPPSIKMPVAPPPLDSGSTAWMLISSALVLLMVPGLALFYGGMVRRKNVLNTMMYSFVAMAVVGVHWVTIGYALAFGQSIGGVIGWDSKYLFLRGVELTSQYGDKGVPELVFIMFQGKFAIITPALISGAVAERMRFGTFVWFILLWTTLVYCPLAHWVWAEGGWLFKMGVLDFAGGTVVHISSGVSALVLAIMVGRRADLGKGAINPYNLALTLTGAGLLWFGWFGFNAGSAVAMDKPVAGSEAVLAFTTTQVAAAAAALAWMLIEWRHHGKPTSLGVASGIVAGLVCITPAAGHVTPGHALIFGVLASAVCYTAVQLKGRLGYDDTLDAFGVHGVGGTLGALLTGVFCLFPAGVSGAISGQFGQLGKQFIGVLAGAGLAIVGTVLIASVLRVVMGLRVPSQVERDGLDLSVHGERVGHADLT